ncbi:glycoside hydrolase family 76 protein [Streptomyces mirabilis]|uniref:glycoside hydrolase family 76 protein n=1 Tax=Streptomyces mirabilis TaxID=68239 RepID=UPI0021BE18D7|nr:glycoside hydrolase family 76 protein [Streptomyces mirabilis]MCT9112230.1 glycoside hydrolase family 76 protein [Streptomyces mirabilis]
MPGAQLALRLHQITGDDGYLDWARRRLFTQPVYFNSIFFKNLLLLESVTGDGKYHQAMADYADELRSTRRDPGTGVVHFDASGGTEAIQQAAFAQLYAVLAWPRELWPTLY